MNKGKKYYSIEKFDLSKLKNIEDRELIHQFENKNLIINIEKLKSQCTLNQLR